VTDIPSAYVRDKRTPPPSREELRARIPGWGVDLDPNDRPSHPKLRYAPEDTGAHWLLLVAADRVDAVEAHLASFATTRPDNPITETGVKGELTHNGWSSRIGTGRADVRHQLLDPVIVAGPWVAAAGTAVVTGRRLVRALGR
jgi:hypothetical protein